MTAPLLAACLVVGDDVRDLHACLSSLRRLAPLLAEICVYGIGADDRVLDAARSVGAKVGVGDADDELAAARNRAAMLTDLPWVFVVDPHERVEADPARLERLLLVEPGMLAQPDVLAIQVRAVRDEQEADVARQSRLYRPAVARFTGGHQPRLEAVTPPRRLRTLTPGRDVIATWRPATESDAAQERARLRRQLARADAVVAGLERGGTGGDELVTALVERARLLREVDEDNAALADLTRARTTRATAPYRWRARQALALLLIKHGHFAGAERCLVELERDGADIEFTAWLGALVSAAQGQARDALDVLRDLETVTAADGRVVTAPEILNERMMLANRVGAFEEALDCCVELVTRHGQSRRYGRMLLKLWGGRSAQALADRLAEADGPHREEVAASLRQLPEPGPQVAACLLAESRQTRPVAVRVM